MKRIIQFFVVCLALSALQTGSVYSAENTRTQSKRASGNTVSTTTNSRTSASTKTDTKKSIDPSRATTTQKITRSTQTAVKSKGATTTTSFNKTHVKQRPNNTAQQKKVSTKSRATVASRVVDAHKTQSSAKTATARTATKKNLSRATRTQAILDNEKIASIKSKNYSQCKTVFYECMDEFCANKDSNLRRCACSSRIHEFDNIKKQLSAAEDKMLDFNQRLVTVSLSKEDAAAINVATEGELGYNTKDKSDSEKLLQNITKTLNSSGDSKLNNELSSISLSLDFDSAWDDVDALAGAQTTTKNGVELYNAAKPVCVEMAKEVCSEDELGIVQSNYQLAIQQDCNTVAKAYDTQYNQAINKIHESGALLDMARLNKYQLQNSDDILTCKKKILEQLNDSSVCGENLYKCLDTTGQYINPSTGQAFLSTNLYNITSLLTAPEGEETWATSKKNEKFVSFLNSKKMYLQTATEQCKDYADVVWSDFLNDALAKIKLAQNSKLEEIRQSCSTLLAECKTGATENLKDFDARAISTFSVLADSTVNSICSNVQTSCAKLMESTGGGDELWQSGMDEIAVDTSYDTIIETCTTVGKDCIIQQCNGTSGNFALCGKYSDQPRRSILSRASCWNEVLACVKQSTNVDKIKSPLLKTASDANARFNFYTKNYSTNTYSSLGEIPTLCDKEDDIACLVTEQIWGNCEYDALKTAITTNDSLLSKYVKKQNRILIPESKETLLSWFAYNTGTTSSQNSCSAYICPMNYKYNETSKQCVQFMDGQQDNILGLGNETISTIDEYIITPEGDKNFCKGGSSKKDIYRNCCAEGSAVVNNICVPSSDYAALKLMTLTCPTVTKTETGSYVYTMSTSDSETVNISVGQDEKAEYQYYCANVSNRQLTFYCLVDVTGNDLKNVRKIEVKNQNLYCPGIFVLIDTQGNYYAPYDAYPMSTSTPLSSPLIPEMYYYTAPADTKWIYTFSPNDSVYRWVMKNVSDPSAQEKIPGSGSTYIPSKQSDAFMIKYRH